MGSLTFEGADCPQCEQQRGLRAVPHGGPAIEQIPPQGIVQKTANDSSAAQPSGAAQHLAAQLAAARQVHHERNLHLRQ